MSNQVLVHLQNRAESKQAPPQVEDVIDFPEESPNAEEASKLALRLIVQRLRLLESSPEKLQRVKVGELSRAYKLLTEEWRLQEAELAAQEKPKREPVGIEEARKMLDQMVQVARERQAE